MPSVFKYTFLHSMVLGFDNLEQHIAEKLSYLKHKESESNINENKAQGDGISSSSTTFTSLFVLFYTFLL